MQSTVRKLIKLFRLVKILFTNPFEAFDRISVIFEIYLNKILFYKKPNIYYLFNDFLKIIPDSISNKIEEANKELEDIKNLFIKNISKLNYLPYPLYYNADYTLAILCYIYVRNFKPELAIETGVGYGISSSMILAAMNNNKKGKLISIDLPPLGDSEGNFSGIAIPTDLKYRWSIYFGSSHKILKNLLKSISQVDFFISDSANVFTIQRRELKLILPKLKTNSVCIFNNISLKMYKFLKNLDGFSFYCIRQEEKKDCMSGLIIKQ